MFPNLNPMEMMVVLGLAVLLFGKRLPEVGRSLGRGIVEFKKGLRGVEEEFRSATDIVQNQFPALLKAAESVRADRPQVRVTPRVPRPDHGV